MNQGHESARLELRLLDFKVPSDWNSSLSGAAPHDTVQAFLEGEGLWGEGFRYGRAPSDIRAEHELKTSGLSAAQQRAEGRSLSLSSIEDSRDRFCDASFFNGERVILVYSMRGITPKGGTSYELSSPSALVAIVRPVLPLP
ncbi:hypothetical protein HYY73_04770 [Candidatus Woesearchaeota archaeon]|nr:hypothetical protein [Candidatus Woesearchaeota archaeon]